MMMGFGLALLTPTTSELSWAGARAGQVHASTSGTAIAKERVCSLILCTGAELRDESESRDEDVATDWSRGGKVSWALEARVNGQGSYRVRGCKRAHLARA